MTRGALAAAAGALATALALAASCGDADQELLSQARGAWGEVERAIRERDAVTLRACTTARTWDLLVSIARAAGAAGDDGAAVASMLVPDEGRQALGGWIEPRATLDGGRDRLTVTFSERRRTGVARATLVFHRPGPVEAEVAGRGSPPAPCTRWRLDLTETLRP
jgi:hypothetical protein